MVELRKRTVFCRDDSQRSLIALFQSVSKWRWAGGPPAVSGQSACTQMCERKPRVQVESCHSLSVQLKLENLSMGPVGTWDSRHVNERLTGLIYHGFSKTSITSSFPRRQIKCGEFKSVFVGQRTNVLKRSLCCCCVW